MMTTTMNVTKALSVLRGYANGTASEAELNAVRAYVRKLGYGAPEDFESLSAAIVCAKRARALRAAGNVDEAAKYDSCWEDA